MSFEGLNRKDYTDPIEDELEAYKTRQDHLDHNTLS
jgi:hypothetical protein